MKIYAKHWKKGWSWGLDWPLMYVDLTPPGSLVHVWAVIERGTGLVKQCFERKSNVHGWSSAKNEAMRASMPPEDGSNWRQVLDDTP